MTQDTPISLTLTIPAFLDPLDVGVGLDSDLGLDPGLKKPKNL
jgi:hypothetical protein